MGFTSLSAFKKVVFVLPYLVVFVASFYRPYDSDLGWHLRYGEYFFNNNRVLSENIFSTEMPHYEWINHSWGTDIVTFALYSQFGFLGLSLVGAGVVTLTFFFFSKAAKLSLWDETILFPLILFYVIPVTQVSLRSQLLSLLLLSILFFIFSLHSTQNKKRLLLLIPLFILWVNIHGQFILGVGIFFLWVGFEVIKRIIFSDPKKMLPRQEILFLSLVALLIIGATLINPFGVRVYQEALNHFGNPTQQFILEWLPFEDTSELWWRHIVLGILLFFSLLFFFFNDILRQKFPFIAITILLLSLSFWMKRFAWPTYFMSLLCLSPISQFFKPNGNKTTAKTTFIILLILLVIIVYSKQPYNQFNQMSWNVYCAEFIHCSPQSVQYIIDKKLNYNLLTFYNWGGYLIWNYPQIKPSIDGRMPFWKDNKGNSAFVEYFAYEQNTKDIDKWKYDVVLMSPEKPMYDRLIELSEENKWNLVYEDDFAGVFVRNKNK